MAGTEDPGTAGRATTGRSARPVLVRFLEAVDDRVAPTTLSKPTLTELCHTLEDQVLAEDLAGTVVTGFQRARYWASERQRYEALIADPRRHAMVFTADDDGVDSTVDRVVVGTDHSLAREWFVLALTSGFSALVFGRELTRARPTREDERRFLAIWSFDPTVVSDLLEVLLAATADLDPACAAQLEAAAATMPPRVPDALMAQRFANAVFERLDAGAPARTEPAPLAQDATPPPAPAAPADAPGERGHRVVLVVDTEPSIRGLEEALLRRDGWVVHTAANADDARQATRDHPVEVLLVDLHLASGQDRDLIADLDRIRPGLAAATVLVAHDPAAVEAPRARAVIRKPVVWDELRTALARLTMTD